VTQRRVLGAAVMAQLAPAFSNLVEFVGTDLARRHHLGEIVEIASPVPVTDCEEEILFRGEMLVDGALRIPGCMGDIVESRCGEAFFGENIFCCVEEQ